MTRKSPKHLLRSFFNFLYNFLYGGKKITKTQAFWQIGTNAMVTLEFSVQVILMARILVTSAKNISFIHIFFRKAHFKVGGGAYLTVHYIEHIRDKKSLIFYPISFPEILRPLECFRFLHTVFQQFADVTMQWMP